MNHRMSRRPQSNCNLRLLTNYHHPMRRRPNLNRRTNCQLHAVSTNCAIRLASLRDASDGEMAMLASLVSVLVQLELVMVEAMEVEFCLFLD